VKTDGRHAEVEFGASLDEDLARRDFTINAIAFSPSTRQLHDPFGGQADLDRGMVRAVGNAAERMREDRLRALRALRFASRFDFAIEPDTWSAIRDSAPFLTRLSVERVKQELDKTMEQVRLPSRALRLWKESGALGVLIPELAGVSDEVLRAVDCAAQPGLPRRPGRRLIRLAVLGCELSPDQLARLTARLKFSKDEAKWIVALSERWQKLAAGAPIGAGASNAPTVRRWVAAIGRTYLPAFFRVAAARWSAAREQKSAPSAREVRLLYRRCLRVAFAEPLDVRDLAVDGDDLRQAGIAPGPGLGRILSLLVERVIDDPALNTREWLIEQARHLHSSGADQVDKGAVR
jgi:tRNA nucleotidyltransferase/poly(A) polymerase